MSPRMFYTLKFLGATLSFIFFGLVSYHLYWLITVVVTMEGINGVLTLLWASMVFYYWVNALWQYANPRSDWWARMMSKNLEEFKDVEKNKDAPPNKTIEKQTKVVSKFADIRIVRKSDTIIGQFNGNPIHESITVIAGGKELVLPYHASYNSMDEIPVNSNVDKLLVVIGNFVTYGMDVKNV